MKLKFLNLIFAVMSAIFFTGCGVPGGEKIGMLMPLGYDENSIKEWSKNASKVVGDKDYLGDDAEIIFFDNYADMVAALKNGRIDKFNAPSHNARYIVSKNDDLKILDPENNIRIGYALLTLKTKTALMKELDDAIDKMKRDGTIKKLTDEYLYNPDGTDPKPVTIPKFPNAETIKFAVTGDLPPMDLTLPDYSPAGFNTAFLAQLAAHLKKNIELVQIDSGARANALASGNVDGLFWVRRTCKEDGEDLNYPQDNVSDAAVSRLYLMDTYVSVVRK